MRDVNSEHVTLQTARTITEMINLRSKYLNETKQAHM